LNALILGASGLVGGKCLDLLLDNPQYTQVVVLGRRRLSKEHQKLLYVVSDLSDLASFEPPVPIHHVFCAFGTTIRKAGSEAEMERIDVGIPLMIARTMKAQGAFFFGLVSSIGANAHSRVFYSRIKGELEQSILALNFDQTLIVRPSMIDGERSDDSRFAEQLFKGIMRVLPLTYRTIPAERIALALVRGAFAKLPKSTIWNSKQLWDMPK